MRPLHGISCLLLIVVASNPSIAQMPTYSADPFRDLPPTSRRAERPPPPKMTFLLEAEIPLPGPLPGGGPRMRGEWVEIPVAGGTVLARPTTDAAPKLIVSPDVAQAGAEANTWVEGERGRFRYRAVPGGAIEAQRRCKRCKAGWKRSWRLRVPGNTLAPPLIADGRLYFGALDNRVYCLKAHNGHRVWVTDLGARVLSPLIHWSGSIGGDSSQENESPQQELSLILAVPDGGSELIALDSARGQTVATLQLKDDEGKLVSGPLATPDGKIVVARQKYAATDASLMVYGLRELVQIEPKSGTPPSRPTAEGSEAGASEDGG